MKQSTELTKRLRQKLCIFDIPINRLSSIHCDNEATYKNVAIPESILSKKMHGIYCHFWKEEVASIIRVAKENNIIDLADLVIKLLGNFKRHELLGRFMYWIALLVSFD